METHSWRQKKDAFTLLSWEGLSTPLSSLASESGSWNTPRCRNILEETEKMTCLTTQETEAAASRVISGLVSPLPTLLCLGEQRVHGEWVRESSAAQNRRGGSSPPPHCAPRNCATGPVDAPGAWRGAGLRVFVSHDILVFLVRTDNAGLVLQSGPSSPELW